jgi:hypothetical protein
VGPRAVLDAVVKRKIPSPRRESNPRTPIIQPLAQRYTDWVITALLVYIYIRQFVGCLNTKVQSFRVAKKRLIFVLFTSRACLQSFYTRVYPKVSGLAAWRESCKWYSSLPLGAIV